MYELFGAREITRGSVTFRVFFPDRALDPQQYSGGGLPGFSAIRVIGDFQNLPWDVASAPVLQAVSLGSGQPPAAAELSSALHAGHVFEVTVSGLPDGFYEYRYRVDFPGMSARTIADPCARYGGKTPGNSGFVLGGRDITPRPHPARLPYRDLVIYELNLDDYTAKLGSGQAPVDAITTQELQRIQGLGFNAIEFMPWTAWPTEGFSWGYNPYQYFSVSHQYTNDPSNPSNKLALLGDLVDRCHALGLHVIMDGVFNHVQADALKLTPDPGSPPGAYPLAPGFGYYWLYGLEADTPFVGNFADHAFFEDLDYANECTLKFIFDVCRFWIEYFEIDGIRLDNTLGLYDQNNRGRGLARLLSDLRSYLHGSQRPNFSLILEHSWDYGAVDVTNKVAATSCWLDEFRSRSMGYLENRKVLPAILRMLNSGQDFAETSVPTIYIENHDHKAFALKASADRNEWWRMQPYLIALYTCAGAVLVHNGQEYANLYDMPEEGNGRVVPRPIQWASLQDDVGRKVAALLTLLAQIRDSHPALRLPNFYPNTWQEQRTQRDADGFGLDIDAQVVVYHRWVVVGPNQVDRYYVVLNFSDDPAGRSVSFKVAVRDRTWKDLLTNTTTRSNGHDVSLQLGRCWGAILYDRAP